MTKPRVLIVDDDAELAEMVSELLLREGWEVRTVLTGGDGERALAQWRPEAVLLDVMLPGLDVRGASAAASERSSDRLSSVSSDGSAATRPFIRRAASIQSVPGFDSWASQYHHTRWARLDRAG